MRRVCSQVRVCRRPSHQLLDHSQRLRSVRLLNLSTRPHPFLGKMDLPLRTLLVLISTTDHRSLLSLTVARVLQPKLIYLHTTTTIPSRNFLNLTTHSMVPTLILLIILLLLLLSHISLASCLQVKCPCLRILFPLDTECHHISPDLTIPERLPTWTTLNMPEPDMKLQLTGTTKAGTIKTR